MIFGYLGLAGLRLELGLLKNVDLKQTEFLACKLFTSYSHILSIGMNCKSVFQTFNSQEYEVFNN